MAVAQQRAMPRASSHPASGTLVIDATLEGLLSFVVYGPGLFDVYTLGVATGEVPGLGRSNQFTFQMPTEQGTVKNGRFFVVAANGDQIIGTYEGTTGPGDEPGKLRGHIVIVVTGGTGCFAKATGSIDAWADVTVAGWEDTARWPVIWALKGVVKY
jgi:hypothetical protein